MNGHHGLENYAQSFTFLAVTNGIHAYIYNKKKKK